MLRKYFGFLSGVRRDELRTFTRVLRPYRLLILTTIIFASGSIVLEIVALLSLAPVLSLIDQGAADSEQLPSVFQAVPRAVTFFGLDYTLAIALGVVVILFIAKAIVQTISDWTRHRISTEYERAVRTELVRAYLITRWDYIVSQPSGRFLNALTTQVRESRTVLISFVVLATEIIGLGVYLAGGFLVSPIAIIVAFLSFGILGVAQVLIFRAIRGWGESMVSSSTFLMQHIGEILSSLKTIKGAQAEEFTLRGVERQTEILRFSSLRAAIIGVMSRAAFEPTMIIAVAIVIAAMHYTSRTSSGEIGIITIILFRLYQRLGRLQFSFNSIATFLPSFLMVSNLQLELQSRSELNIGDKVPAAISIKLTSVCYGYPNRTDVLKDVNLHILDGAFIGIIGPSGSGKSTLIDLIHGMLQPSAGKITIDGIDLRDIDTYQWRSMVGYVGQEPILFNDTVYKNVVLDKAIPIADFWWALSLAQAESFVRQLPKGEQTLVGDRGAQLSGGQRQRLALARALVTKPRLLLLDEATSSIDPETESEFYAALQSLRGRVTIISVAHRRSTLHSVDQIVVVENGEVSRVGSPIDLLADADDILAKEHEDD